MQLRKENDAHKQAELLSSADTAVQKAETINGLSCVLLSLDGFDTNSLKAYAENVRNKLADGFVFVSNTIDGKVTFVCASSKAAITKGKKAGDIVKAAAQLTGGNGGGRPDMAQAGGKDTSKVQEAHALVREILAQ